MFRIDRASNRIHRLEQKRFADLGLRERDHLQEWLANMPDALGEELLIIQKEFDGFDDTRERLDLLALDKEGRLVVIENKLDDTGRNVVWQAIKYAAYVSSLTRAQIVDIYQAYLDRQPEPGNAATLICEFLEADDLEELVLNPGNSQRVVMIAANFRKEVTATALWLLHHGIATQCFRATPYAMGDNLFLDLQQFIPVPDAEEYMIGIASKEAEEKTAEGAKNSRQDLRREFWEKTLTAMREAGVTIYQNVNPGRDQWLTGSTGISNCTFNLIFGKAEARVEVYMSRPNGSENKAIFDALMAQREAIEADFGAPLVWQRLDDAKSCRIKYAKPFDGYNRANWDEITAWLVTNIQKLDHAFRGPLHEVRHVVRAAGETL
ncbi:DUF4268 domain-containing protein [Acuticoccus mangrovi]|uniref:DUF4268 domain-containing protein n=1 Tax=Acuticoccus mangrovi TaxID=2796142 RepID=A0A934IPN2_9HYPH|nr:DUF4268 domain-containing protein [Acuticoccus mangrovi]MBJ3775299.1 DUF4268 domain-containing protein [Acuticoccus mangrovi]